MALDERIRDSLLERLTPLVGREEAAALVIHHADNHVTEAYLDARLAQTSAELRTELHKELREMSTRLITWMLGAVFSATSLSFAAAALAR